MQQAVLPIYTNRPAFSVRSNQNLDASPSPNAETLQAIASARAKQDTVACQDSQTLFEALGI